MKRLKSKSGTLRLFLSAKLEVFASFERHLHFVLAHCALKSQHDLLRRLSLLVEDGLSLTTIP